MVAQHTTQHSHESLSALPPIAECRLHGICCAWKTIGNNHIIDKRTGRRPVGPGSRLLPVLQVLLLLLL
jgi:hypothetical protein